MHVNILKVYNTSLFYVTRSQKLNINQFYDKKRNI